MLTISRLLRYGNRTFELGARLKRVRDGRAGVRVQLAGRVLLVGLLAVIWGQARSIRTATARPGGLLGEAKLRKALLGLRHRGRKVVAHASTLYAYLQQVVVGHLQRLNVQICKRLKQMKAVQFEGVLAACLDATGIPTPTDVYATQGTLSQTRKKKTKDGQEVEVKNYYYLLSNLYTVGGPASCYLGFQVAQVGEAEASRAVLKWAASQDAYGSRFLDVLLADALYCNQVDLKLFNKIATTGWIVRANRNVGAVVDAERLLSEGEREVCTIQGDRTVVRAVALQWPEVGENLKLLEVSRDGGDTLLFVSNLQWALARLARLGRARWGIENNLHKEIKHEWPFRYLASEALHGLKAWWWLVALAFNLFHAFFDRQVQSRLGARRFPSLRAAREYFLRHLLDGALRRVVAEIVAQEEFG